MPIKRTLAAQLTAPAFAALVALTVFLWGSAYKCSLYHRHPEKHARVATAKLLSERERPVAPGITAQGQPPQALNPALGVPPFGHCSAAPPVHHWMAPAVPIAALPGTQREVSARGKPYLIHFSFRPPPALLA